MTLNLVRRSTKGSPLTAVDHDGNLDKIEQAIEGIEPTRWDGGSTGLNASTARTSLGLGTAATTDASAYATAAQGAKADTAIQPGNAALTDAREWSAETISQAEAEAGSATTRRAFTAQRVFQAAAAWWAGSAAKTKLDGIASGATANATDAQLRDRSTHTGTQSASTITGLATVATSGAYADLSGRPTLGTAAAANTGTSAGNVPVLDGAGLVPSALLPGFVDDVLEFANVAAFPATGEAGKLYISLATNRQYRWSGSTYVEINPSPGSTDAVPEGSVNLYFTAGRAAAAAPVQSVAGRTGSVTLSVGDVSGAVGTSDARLTDSREWNADTISQNEAETGTSTTRRAFTALRVRQAIAAWWSTITTIGLPAGSAPSTPATGFALFANASNALSWIGANGFTRTFDGTTNTANRTYTLPNASGTVALTSDIPGVATTSTAGLMPALSFAAITYAASVALDMSALDGQVRTISLTGNLELTTSNRAAGRTVTLRLVADATQRTLTFPAGWVFIGTKPANIAASKTGVLSLTFFGSADTDCVAAWGVQA